MPEKSDSSLNETFSHHGEWWLPDNDNVRVIGTLNYQPRENMSVHTFGSKTLIPWSPIDVYFAPIIIGYAEDKHYYTLVNSHVVSKDSTFVPEENNYYAQVFKCRYLIQSKKKPSWKSIEEIEFTRMSVGFHFLSEWFGHYPIHDKPLRNVALNRTTGMASILRYPPVDEFSVPHSESTIKTSFRGNIGTSTTNFDRTHTLNYSSALQLEPPSKMRLLWYLDLFEKLNQLLLLLFGRKTFFNYIGGKFTTDNGDSRNDAVVYILHPKYADIPIESRTNEFFIPYDKIPDLGELFSSWLEQYESYKNPINLFSTTIFDSSLYQEVKLLLLTQSFESFYREFVNEQYMDNDAYHEAIQGLYNHIPVDTLTQGHRASIRQKLHYGYEYSLGKKLDLLLRGFSDDFKTSLFRNREGRDDFVRWVVDTRNYHTHYDFDEQKQIITDDSKLERLNKAVECCLFALFLKYLNFREDDLVSVLESKYELPIDLRDV